jgi:cobalt transporter subunit CbtB
MARRRAFLVDHGGALAFSKNKVNTWSRKMDRETSLETVAAVEEGTRMAAVVVAVLLGVFILMGSGFVQADVLHNAAHDARHAFAFPCH